MPVPSTINDLSTTAGSNSPAGSDSPTTIDDHIRALASFVAQLRDKYPSVADSAGTFTVSGALAYTSTLTGGTGVINIGSGQVYKDASGNVGVGTASPGQKLHVQGNAQALSGSATTPSWLSVGRTSADAYFGAAGATNDFITGTTQGDAVLYLSTSKSLIFGTNNNERMRIDASGNVGQGVVPSAWNAAWKQYQFPAGVAIGTDGTNMQLRLNSYADSGGTEKFIGTGYAANYYMTPSGTHVWRTSSASGSAGGAVTWSEAMRLDSGNRLGVGATPATSGNNNGIVQLAASSSSGIFFGNTDNSATNVLDWYEEGSFTPTISFDSGGSVSYYSTNTGGFYTRIGNTVNFTLRVSLTAVTAGSGSIYVNGLPYFTSSDVNKGRSALAASVTNFSSLSGAVLGTIGSNSKTITLGYCSASGTTPVLPSSLTATSTITITGTYMV